MILAKVIFGRAGKRDRYDFEMLAGWYIVSMLQNGQILGDYLHAWKDGILNAYAYLAAPDAVVSSSFSEWGRKWMQDVSEAFGKEPEWTILDDDVPKRTPRWQTALFLVLYADAFSFLPPVRRGEDGKPVPTYRLPPLKYCEHEAVYHWQRDYQFHDHLWLNSGTLEIPAYREIADPNSSLSGEGRRICEEIEHATGKPTYYYLVRYYGRKKGEEKRRCPECGGKWRTDLPEAVGFDLGRFHFQCEKCRLVSHLGDTDEDERHARIGEYRSRKRGTR